MNLWLLSLLSSPAYKFGLNESWDCSDVRVLLHVHVHCLVVRFHVLCNGFICIVDVAFKHRCFSSVRNDFLVSDLYDGRRGWWALFFILACPLKSWGEGNRGLVVDVVLD